MHFGVVNKNNLRGDSAGMHHPRGKRLRGFGQWCVGCLGMFLPLLWPVLQGRV